MRGAMRYELPLWVLWALLVLPATADVIFRVPEVLVRHAAAPKAVGTGSIITRNDTRPDPRPVSIRQSGTARQEAVRANETDRDSWSGGGGLLEVRYEEYFVEHDVSTADARKAAKELNLANVPETHVGCGTCSRRELDYCETRLLADHCCCEQQFFPEPFPWLPHTCYMGANRCKPLVHDCARYARLRDCCCYKKLAERWKGILSSSPRMSVNGVSLLLLSMLLFVAYL